MIVSGIFRQKNCFKVEHTPFESRVQLKMELQCKPHRSVYIAKGFTSGK